MDAASLAQTLKNAALLSPCHNQNSLGHSQNSLAHAFLCGNERQPSFVDTNIVVLDLFSRHAMVSL
jgi:hypothetical protein